MVKLKHILSVVLILLLGGLFYLMAHYEVDFMKKFIMPPEGMTDEEWNVKFIIWGRYIIISAVAASLIWYAVGWFHKINDWRGFTMMKVLYYLIILLPAIICVWVQYKIPTLDKGMFVVVLFYIVNGLLLYYILTILLSPPSLKYIPPGARNLRRW